MLCMCVRKMTHVKTLIGIKYARIGVVTDKLKAEEKDLVHNKISTTHN